MPLKPKNGLLPARTTAANSRAKTVPMKTATKSAGKSAPAGKKPGPGKKAPRASAGFELYSSDEDVSRQRNDARPQRGTEEPLRTLVEDWMSRQTPNHSLTDSNDSREIMPSVERHRPRDETARFNKRLVSSTPDPERLLDDSPLDVQMIPERDTESGPGGEAMSRRLTECRTAAYLTGTERQLVRQQLDAALIEEAQTQNKGLQEQWKIFQMNQQGKTTGASSAAPQGQPSVKKRALVDSAVPQKARQANVPRALTKSGPAGAQQKNVHFSAPKKTIPEQFSAPKKTMPRAQATNAAAQDVESATSTWHHIMAHGLPARGSDVGVFHHFLNRDSSDLPPNLQQNQTTQGEVPLFSSNDSDTEPVPNMSMGFTPYKGNQTAPFNTLPPGVHLATPACSPAKSTGSSQPAPRNPQLRNGSAAPPPYQYQHTSAKQTMGDLSTPATSPETEATKFSGRAQQSQNHSAQRSDMLFPAEQPASRTQPNRDMNRKANAGSYTCDGYYINGPVNTAKISDDESPPQPRPFTPQPTQPSLLSNGNHVATNSSSGANMNNNSDAYNRQGNTNQNMHNDVMYQGGTNQRGYPPGSMQDFVEQTRPSREAMAEMDFAGFPFSAEAHMMLNEDVLDPPAPMSSLVPQAFADREVMNGPRRLRALLHELKETCAIEGDMEVCHLVQQICDVIEVLPQLKPTFNLEAEIGLALQPLRSECSQLRRRLRILNQQLRERERQAKEGIDPKVQVEILTLQTENLELQKRLTEAEQSCHKLNLYIGNQQQQIQTLQYQLQQKEHEKLVARQENVQQLNRLNQEVEKMSLRNQSLQSKLAAADCQNSVLDLNLKQSNMDIVQLQDTLGRMKQAVLEVMQHVDNNADSNTSLSSSKVRNLPSFRVLSGMLKSASSTPRSSSSDNTTSSSRGPLDISGNQRAVRFSKPDRSQNARPSNSYEGSRKESPRDAPHFTGTHRAKQQSASEESVSKHAPPTKDTSLSSVKFDSGDEFLSKDSLLSTGPITPYPLTLEAVAAHNDHIDSLSEGDLSCHSWDGTKKHRTSLGNESLPYHSDPETAAVPSKPTRTSSHTHYSRIRQWSTGVEEEWRHAAGSSQQSSFHDEFEHTARKSKSSSDGKADSLSLSETRIAPSLSEFPISEASGSESLKHSASARDATQQNESDFFRKHSETQKSAVTTKSLPPSPSKPGSQDPSKESATPRPKETSPDKTIPAISSPNSSVGHSMSNTSQKDFFHGTELDMSLSTIQEDGLSCVTSLTGASVNTAMLSLNDQKFREGVSALDDKITKCKASLQVWKKTFS